jgi:hypothetical protein
MYSPAYFALHGTLLDTACAAPHSGKRAIESCDACNVLYCCPVVYLGYYSNSISELTAGMPIMMPMPTAGWTFIGHCRPPSLHAALSALRSGQSPRVWNRSIGSTACRGSKEVGTLLGQLATSAANRQWRMLGTRNVVTEARAFIIAIARPVSALPPRLHTLVFASLACEKTSRFSVGYS